MADSYDLSTLLPIETLRQIAQHYGCPSFLDPDAPNAAYDEDRNWGLWLFSGRMPSPAEFYYGLYIDREGDSHATKPVTLQEKLVGKLLVKNNAHTGNYHAVMGHDMRAHGAVWPDGEAFAKRGQNATMVRAEPLTYAGPDWVLDWAFDSNKPYYLSGGNRGSLGSWDNAGDWVGPAQPTWFWLTSDGNDMPEFNTMYMDKRDANNDWAAVIQQMKDTYAYRRPMIMGTAGPIGSGADLQLSTGGDGFNQKINLISLRVVLNETA